MAMEEMKRFRNTVYFVTPDGRVYNSRFGKYLKSLKGRNDNFFCVLRVNGESEKHQIHRMVAELYLPPPKVENMSVKHKDGNKRNNHYTNLAYGMGSFIVDKDGHIVENTAKQSKYASLYTNTKIKKRGHARGWYSEAGFAPISTSLLEEKGFEYITYSDGYRMIKDGLLIEQQGEDGKVWKVAGKRIYSMEQLKDVLCLLSI